MTPAQFYDVNASNIGEGGAALEATGMIANDSGSGAARALNRPCARERLISAARELFYRRGIHTVGVEAVAEAAGTNKMTLYRHFASKDALVAACLRATADEWDADWEKIQREHPNDPIGQLHAWANWIARILIDEADRGCALVNAAIELPNKDHPARRVIEEYKNAYREKIMTLCRAAGYLEPDRLADEFVLLIEGARVSIQSVGARGPGARIATLLNAIIDTHPRLTPDDRTEKPSDA
jgi:AcrR family transcriptional regulator